MLQGKAAAGVIHGVIHVSLLRHECCGWTQSHQQISHPLPPSGVQRTPRDVELSQQKKSKEPSRRPVLGTCCSFIPRCSLRLLVPC